MKAYLEAERQDRKRKRRERYIIAALVVVISFLTYLGSRAFDLGLDLPFSGNILIFALINLNVILLLLLLFLTVRNLVKLLFERRKRIMGARLRTKLVLAFVTLSLFPTIIIFFVSVQFISASMEYWFNLPIERSLKNSLEVGQDYYHKVTEEMLAFGNDISRLITYQGFMLIQKEDGLRKFVSEKRREYHLASLMVLSQRLETRAVSKDDRIDMSPFRDPGVDLLRKCMDKGTDSYEIQSSPMGDLVGGIVPVFSRTESKAVVGLVALSRFIPGAFVNRLRGITRGIEEYEQLKILKKPIKLSHMITLSIVTLLVIFSSVWFGFFLSREITVPIQEMADGTKRIAAGDYDFFIETGSSDEIGVLVDSFNKMTLDLKESKKQLEETNKELISSNVELEQRRLYMETVLANVAAGVVSADRNGKILTMNKSAERMLDVKADDVVGKDYREVIAGEHVNRIEGYLRDGILLKRGSIERQINVRVEDRTLNLLVILNVLRDEKGRYGGLVAVFEDITEIQKAQRMAAWREVARRIAHEVKNPLTPIQLSAQRLKRKYGQKLALEDGQVFDECTNMIIKQVEELKRLVDEFSRFARMPASNPAPVQIQVVIDEALSLYRETENDLKITFKECGYIPVMKLDREQIKRAMINLLDNAIDSTGGRGEICIELSYVKEREIVKIEIADTGKGVPPEHKGRLFEPYFSTKKHGTGLGLTIVSTIISDHNGFIRVEDNLPCGARFIIELPVRI